MEKKVQSSIPLVQAYIDSFENGYAKAYAKGYAKGYAKAKAEVALKMQRVGIQLDTICQCTGFSHEQLLDILRTSTQPD